ncbi:hypothetical protein PFISCL1PPCAC_4718, partial [Pristionchus fissidentatus]
RIAPAHASSQQIAMARLFVCIALLIAALFTIAAAQSSEEIRTLCEKAACGNDECRIYGVNLDFAAMCMPRSTMRFVF